jgi:hypothetical protein
VSAEWLKLSESRLVWLSVNVDIDPSIGLRFWSQCHFHNVNEMDHDRDVIARPKTPYVVSCYDQCHRLPLKSIVCHFRICNRLFSDKSQSFQFIPCRLNDSHLSPLAAHRHGVAAATLM